jgi:MFS family permease
MIGVTGLAAIATSPGQSFLLGIFNTSLLDAAGVRLDVLSLAYMIGTFASATTLTFVGHWSDVRGPRRLAFFATLGLGLACLYFALGAVTGVITLAIGFFLLRFFGQGCLMLASTHALALWFDRRLGFAESLRLAIFAAGMMALPTATAFLVKGLGYQWTFAIYAAAVWGVMLPVIWLVWRNAPADVGQAPIDLREPAPADGQVIKVGLTLKQAVVTPAYLAQAAVVAYFAAVGTALVFHAQPILISAGRDEPAAILLAATCVTTWAGFGFAFHFVGGQLVDRLPPGPLLAGVAVTLGLAAWLSADAEGYGRAVAAFAVLGAAHGTITTVGSPIIVRHFGRRAIGAIKGSISTVGVAASGLGPAAVAVGAQQFGFEPTLAVTAALALPLAIGAWFIKRPVWS